MKKENKKASPPKAKIAKSKSSQLEKDDATIHTTNPFTGEKSDITPEDLENLEKWNEAQTERD